MVEKNKYFIFSLIIILITLNISFLIQQESFLSMRLKTKKEDIKKYEINQYSNNDTVAPVITFVQPLNNSVIKKNFYEIIVNVSDDHLPEPGNVIVQISNISTSFFNATMNLEGDRQWFFNWDNISSYPNYNIYKIEVWAKDSSVNGNYNWSEAYYVFLNLSEKFSPDILNGLLYIILVSLIFAVICVYFKRKSTFIRATEQT
ncbi:MAG: hypothetical protein ACFFHD_03325 [Promethearchaeota archaeon]